MPSCHDCGATFSRNEHFQRHRLRHLGLRPFTCDQCPSAFSRKDALSRHMQVHDTNATPPKRQKTSYISQACIHCAKSKQCCDGQSPCARCTSKLLGCAYAPLKRGRHGVENQRILDGDGQVPEHCDSDQSIRATDGLVSPEGPGSTNLLESGNEPRYGSTSSTSLSSAGQTSMQNLLDPTITAPGFGIDQNFLSSCGSAFQNLGWDSIDPFCGQGMWPLLDYDPTTFLGHAADLPENSTKQRETQRVGGFAATSMPSPAETEVEMLATDAPPPTFTQTADASSPIDGAADTAEPSRDQQMDYHHVPSLTQDTYEMMISSFTRLNADNEFYVPFTAQSFPPMNHINIFIQVYFEEFHPVFPFLHKATFVPRQDEWLLVVAVAAVGCIFSRTLRSEQTFHDLHEFLRRAIHIKVERFRTSPPDIHLAQATILNQVGMMYSGEMRLAEAVPATMALLATLCKRISFYGKFSQFGVPLDSVVHSNSMHWEDWLREESKRRLFYFAWVLDCQYSCFWSAPAVIPIELLQLPMPSHESTWDASSREEWQESLSKSSYSPVPLRQRLLDLYCSCEVTNVGEFNTLLLTMGVYHDAPKLRNAFIFLDLLQRHAAALPPTKLSRAVQGHIHLLSLFARLPVRELFAFSGWRVTEAQRATNVIKLGHWIQNNNEAKVAVTHACRAWSTIRTKPTAAQHEGIGVLLAALAIWAWIELGQRPATEEVSKLPTVRLDDFDEETKDWYTDGQHKRIYLGGVGCLWDRGASNRLACLACQKRKSKCDGERPSCCQCQKRLIQCVYQQRKFRGPGKSKEYAHKLEERLKRLEESLKPGSSSSTESFDVSGGHAGQVQDINNSPSALLEPTATTTAPNQANVLSQNPTTLHLCPLERTCIMEPSNQVPNIQRQRPVFLQMHFIEFIRAVTETGAFKMQLFSPQHGHSKVLSRLDDIIQDISEMYPVLDISHFQELLTPRESDNDVDKSARLAIGNASLALGIHCKTANSAFADLSPAAWAYFKSAFSTVPRLAFQGSSTLAHEAILIMAMFMLGNADLHMASHLNTLALRAYQTCEVSCSHNGSVETQSQLRVFWTLASLDIDLTFRIGIPPIISDLSDKDLPTENTSDPAGCPEARGMNCGANILRMRAELARIQLDTYRQLLSRAAKRSSQQDLSLRAERLDQDLESWKANIPSVFQPREEHRPGLDTLPLPVIVLHFVFYDLKMKLRSMTGGNPLGDCIPWARATIRLVHCLPTQQFAALWRVLVYPTSAALVLLAAVSNNVVGFHPQPGVTGIRELTGFLYDMSSRKGCDVEKSLPWLSRFEEVAAQSIAHDSVYQHQEAHKVRS
ncbi:hypothetical protein LCI18_008034 [Fusarium solani-melongenae]|uniref:Uncharacterized protein n=1 Tax=Fusarium solani subsp. cucurbitae TaxID=2747967 RepID=A0ACD3Z773_FUSSC|nr:hypothetical protein LCI18_008034 [Fusarium solani-melongenae]